MARSKTNTWGSAVDVLEVVVRIRDVQESGVFFSVAIAVSD